MDIHLDDPIATAYPTYADESRGLIAKPEVTKSLEKPYEEITTRLQTIAHSKKSSSLIATMDDARRDLDHVMETRNETLRGDNKKIGKLPFKSGGMSDLDANKIMGSVFFSIAKDTDPKTAEAVLHGFGALEAKHTIEDLKKHLAYNGTIQRVANEPVVEASPGKSITVVARKDAELNKRLLDKLRGITYTDGSFVQLKTDLADDVRISAHYSENKWTLNMFINGDTCQNLIKQSSKTKTEIPEAFVIDDNSEI